MFRFLYQLTLNSRLPDFIHFFFLRRPSLTHRVINPFFSLSPLFLCIPESSNDNYFGAYKVGSTIIIPKVSSSWPPPPVLNLFPRSPDNLQSVGRSSPVHDIYSIPVRLQVAEEAEEGRKGKGPNQHFSFTIFSRRS